ncbi:MAG: prolipoprotein diacylglyceryl transferase family protein [Saprospiraceae bacterium]
MKTLFTLSAPLFAMVLIAGALGTVIVWKPSDIDAALAWNLAIIMAPALALAAQWKAARERQFPIVTVLTVVAILNTSIVLGSRLGAWTGEDWMNALMGDGLPTLPGKTVMGGLVLMLLVYFVLRSWWRLPAGLADVLMLGLPLAAVSGRVGCLLAGCCYGIPTDSDWGIAYGPGTPAYMQQIQTGVLNEGAASTTLLFPIQLFLIAGNLLIFILLWHSRNRFTKPGALALLGFALLTFQRFGVEFLREVATNRGAFGTMWSGLKIGQWVMLIMALGSIAGFCALYFSRQKNSKAPVPNIPRVTTAQHAYALAGITLIGFLLRDLMTLDEAMVILVSCLPAMLLLGRQLWREYCAGRSVLAPASMLSATAIVLMLNPIDSIPNKALPGEWKRWMEVGAAGSFGNYKEISRDCDGTKISEDIIKTNSGGAEFSANWQRGWTKLQVGLRGAFGKAKSDDNNYDYNNYRYSSIGLHGRADSKFIGASLGFFNRQRNFLASVDVDNHSRNEFLPSASLRFGRLDRYFIDFRYYDEPMLGLSNEPIFSFGFLNVGFNDPNGNSLLRAGMALTSVGETAFNLAGQFPLGKTGINGGFSAYLGNANMLSLGLRYRFRER